MQQRVRQPLTRTSLRAGRNTARLLRVLARLLAAAWLVFPGFGLVDLTVTWNPEWPVMLEAGWGVLVSAGLGLPLLLAASRPGQALPSLVQAGIVTATLAIAAVAGREPEMWWMFVGAGLSLAVLGGLQAARPRPAAVGRTSWILVALAALASPLLLPYAWDMAAANRLGLPGDVTNDVDHYAVQSALGLALVALPLVAAWWPPGRRLLGTSTAAMAGYCALVSAFWPGADGGWTPPVSVALLVWAALVGVTAWWTPPARRAA